jgi:sulfate adenylyltransferase subunit 2
MWMAVTDFLQPEANETVEEQLVRFRTVGDATCTAAIESSAATVEDIIAETSVARVTERGATRADDRMSEAGMEDRKRTGYF